jgi:hypothetical protein
LESFDAGINAESALFDDLLYHSLQGRAYRHIFFAERSSSSSSTGGGKTIASSGGDLVNGKGTIGVIGAGTMGRGIAVSFLRAGYGPVILVDVNPDGLAAGVKDVRSILEGESKRGKLDSSKLNLLLSHIKSSSDQSSLVQCDLIVEAAFENLKVKREIFTKLDAIVTKKDALILSNTSTLDVDAIASSLSPERRQYCAGMHFFSPAHVMKLVELVLLSLSSSSMTLLSFKMISCLVDFLSSAELSLSIIMDAQFIALLSDILFVFELSKRYEELLVSLYELFSLDAVAQSTGCLLR